MVTPSVAAPGDTNPSEATDLFSEDQVIISRQIKMIIHSAVAWHFYLNWLIWLEESVTLFSPFVFDELGRIHYSLAWLATFFVLFSSIARSYATSGNLRLLHSYPVGLPQCVLKLIVHIVGLEQERTSCNSGETEKIEKQTSHGV